MALKVRGEIVDRASSAIAPLIAMGLALLSCRQADREPARDSMRGHAGTPPVASLADSALDELRYPATLLPGGVVTLHGGEWEGPLDSTDGVIRRGAAALVLAARGNLTGNGRPAAVVVLRTDPGATGRFFDLIPVLPDSANHGAPSSPVRGPRAGRATSLGDRIRLDTLWVADERVWVRMLTQGPGDGLCCPTQREERRYRLLGDSLALDTTLVLGRLKQTP